MEDRVHSTWLHSDRTVPSRFIRPALQFTHTEAAGGIVLLIAAVVALAWANSPWGDSYFSFWDIHLELTLGSFHLDESLKHIVNDGLMVIFFFVVGLEIKRELVVGELNELKKAMLPAIAALGGMVVPAAIYLAFVAGVGGEASQGWGIPMATDIAFSVGVISLLGTRVSVGAKLFLLALAIADDVGAIIVIAIFYTSDLNLGFLAIGIAGLAAIFLANRVGIRSYVFYVPMALVVWFAVFESGVHATLAGVAIGLLTPVFPMYSDKEYRQRASWILQSFDMAAASPDASQRIDAQALAVSAVSRESVSPLKRLEIALHPWSSFVVIPLFALANAGVAFSGIDIGEALTHPVTLGVGVGLVAGKFFGITAFTWLAVRFGLGKLPKATSWTQIFGLASLAGIGFTVSLFIAELAFTDFHLIDRAKIGIFIGSGLAGVIGYALLRRGKPLRDDPSDSDDLQMVAADLPA